jgi:hypothetical protein
MSLFWIMLEGLAWHFAFIACGILYTLIFAYVMYFRALGQVIEERKHQRQIELLAMQMEMEQLRHGTVTDDAGSDPLGIGGDAPAGAGPDETEGAADG